MKPNTLIERLRGIIRVPVNDGAGLLDGKDFFERSFPTSNLAREAADEIERLNRRVVVLETVIREDLQPADCSDDLNRMIVEGIHAVPGKERGSAAT